MSNTQVHARPPGAWFQQPFHPFLFAVFPVLTLFARNIGTTPWGATVRPLWVVLLAVAILNLALVPLFRSLRKAALVASLLVVPFFSIGHFQSLIGAYHADLPEIVETEQTSAPALAFYIAWAVSVAVCAMLLFRTTRQLRRVTTIINVVSAALVLMPTSRIITYEVRYAGAGSAFDRTEHGAISTRSEGHPNIYYIMLDGYGRSDVLRYLFDYDNSDFIAFLRGRGFYVAGESCSNYVQTLQSLASTLNFNYLETLLRDVPPKKRGGGAWLDRLFQNNRVARNLKERGYTYVAFDSGFWSPEEHDADVIMRPGRGFSLFENELINTTPIADLLTALPAEDQHGQHRQRILFTLDHLADTAEFPGPVFVFAHIFAGHAPFVFNEFGEPVSAKHRFSFGFKGSSREYLPAYRGQIAFITEKLKTTINDILARSEQPPVIIMNGDHGSRMLLGWEGAGAARFSECFPILNCYYLPGGAKPSLYEGISPVNTFRVVFNRYFGTDYPLLRDRCFYSTREERHKFREIDRDTIVPSKEIFLQARSMPAQLRHKGKK